MATTTNYECVTEIRQGLTDLCGAVDELAAAVEATTERLPSTRELAALAVWAHLLQRLLATGEQLENLSPELVARMARVSYDCGRIFDRVGLDLPPETSSPGDCP